MGGIAGHAGLFSRADEVLRLMELWMFPNKYPGVFLNTTTTSLFTKEYNHSQSSRALGWNTNDPTVFDEGWDQSCGTLSSTTYMHLGWVY